MEEKKQKLQAGGWRREFAVDATKIGDLFSFTNHSPINEYDALMQAAPGEEPAEIDNIIVLRNAIIECVDKLNDKDKFCLDAIFSERITYEQLGIRLGYSNENSKSTGSSSAFLATKRALSRLEKHFRKHPVIMEYIESIEE